MKLRIILFVFFSQSLLCSLFALDISNGLIRIQANEITGLVNFYRLLNAEKNQWEPLLYDEDKRTSFDTLIIDGKIIKPQSDNKFRIFVGKIDNGILVSFRSGLCLLEKRYTFWKSTSAIASDGISISVKLESFSEKPVSIGLRVLLDTWLGEKSGIHFVTTTKERVAKELMISAKDGDNWIATPGNKAVFILQFLNQNTDGPDKVYLANWRRISKSPWDLEYNPLRDFSLAPYSINDSAIALLWTSKMMTKGETINSSMLMGTKDVPGFATSKETPKVVVTALQPTSKEKVKLMETDIEAIRALIKVIDRAIDRESDIKDSEITDWKKSLDNFEERAKAR